MSLRTIAKKVLFKLLDIILPLMIDIIIESEDVVEEYAKSKADKFKERLTVDELKNEINDIGKFIRDKL